MLQTWRLESIIDLDRNLQVFSSTGELLYEYEGRFDVHQNRQRITIDIVNDENEVERVYIYVPAGIVIISEIE